MNSTTKSLQVDPALIQQAAIAVFGITHQEMESNARHTPCADCRRAIVGLISKHTNLSYAKIGKYVGNRHRSTIDHSLESFENLYTTDKQFANKVNLIEEKLRQLCG